MGSDPQYARYPDLSLAQHIFHLTNHSSTKDTQEISLKALQDAISEHKMAPLYRHLAHPVDGLLNTAGEGSAQKSSSTTPKQSSSVASIAAKRKGATKVEFPWDEKLYEQLLSDNDKELEGFKGEEEEAAEKAGETEVQAAKGKGAEFWARVGDKDKAISAYEAVLEKIGILGTKIDLVLAIIRVGLFFNDKLLVKKNVERAKALVDSGGDWDRRNRLKAYEGLHLLTVRSYNLAAPLLLDSLSTFTSYELCTYSSLVIYSVLAGSVSLKRLDFKSKVVDAPEIKAILGDGEEKLSALTGAVSAGPGASDEEMKDASTATPAPAATAVNLTTLGQSSTGQPEVETPIDFAPLAQLVSSLYTGNYQAFFLALAAVEESFLSQDRYLFEHRGWFVREMRLRGYQQLLQSYRVVGLGSMAHDFGVSVDFLDRDLAKFIAADRIPCTIDRVNGLIETNRPDDKNKQYNDVVKQGDALITKLQKYGQARSSSSLVWKSSARAPSLNSSNSMSIDINWDTLTSGPDGLALAETIRDFVHDKFQQIALPSLIRSVQVHSFEFGAVAPEVELKDICDPLPDFYEDGGASDEDSEGEEEENEHRDQSGQTLRERRNLERLSMIDDLQGTASGMSRRSPMVLDPQQSALRSVFFPSEPGQTPSTRGSTPGIPGGTSNLSYFHSPLATGLSGNQTPLSAVVGPHFPSGWHDSATQQERSTHRHAESTSSLSPPSTSHSAKPGISGLSPDDHPHSGGDTEPSQSSPQDAGLATSSQHLERRSEDTQVVFRVRYHGDVKLSLTADILLDYPMPSFVGIPLKLNITGLSFDGVAVIAYIRKRAHFCFLSPEDALTLVGDERSDHDGPRDDADNKQDQRREFTTRKGGLLQEIQVESEIGQRQDGRQSLKNVGKVEKFVLEQVRRIFEEEFVYPSFWTFLV
ncbi:MAG: hypothetical protein M1833_003711 [Piccolia ochrophora]|nr:MAG: hypothetical protein M1833_003711 [Piccolia ochrophora]